MYGNHIKTHHMKEETEKTSDYQKKLTSLKRPDHSSDF